MPSYGSTQSIIQTHNRLPARDMLQATYVTLEVHDLIAGIRHIAQSQLQTRIDQIANAFGYLSQRHRETRSHIEYAGCA